MYLVIDDILHEVLAQDRVAAGWYHRLIAAFANSATQLQIALQRARRARLTGEDVAPPPTVRFACAESSPERGDILQAMLDARLHPDSVVGRGGTFEGALFSGLRLRGQALEGVSLRGARLASGAAHTMTMSLLIEVSAEAADFTRLEPTDTRFTGIGWPASPPAIAFALENAERQMSLLGDLCRAGRQDVSFRNGQSSCAAGHLLSGDTRVRRWCEILRGANVAGQVDEADIAAQSRDITALVLVTNEQLGSDLGSQEDYGVLLRPGEIPPEMKSGVLVQRSHRGREATIHLFRPSDCPQ
jgi:hypothetical protein